MCATQTLFIIVKPLCDRIKQDGGVEEIVQLRQILESCVGSEKNGLSHSVNDLKDFLVIPLISHLRNNRDSSWRVKEEIVKCLCVVLQHSVTENAHFFSNIFADLFLLLTSVNNPQKVAKVSEELKSLVLCAVGLLVKKCSDHIRDELYAPNFRPQLGHGVFVLLRLSEEEKNRQLKISAMETLACLGQYHRKLELSGIDRGKLGQVFAGFLPGITMCLTKMATGDEKQGNKVIAYSIDVWTYFVTLVMRDEFLASHIPHLGVSPIILDLQKQLLLQIPSEFSMKEALNGQPHEKIVQHSLPEVHITSDWVTQTAEKLVMLINAMAKMVSYSHWRVRLSVINWAEQLLLLCSISLSSASVTLVETLATLGCDDYTDVSTRAEVALHKVKEVILNGEDCDLNGNLIEKLEEHIFTLTSRVPTVLGHQDDILSLAFVRQIKGVMMLLAGVRLEQVFTYPVHLQRLLRALTFALSFNTCDSELLLDRTLTDNVFPVDCLDTDAYFSFEHWCHFQHFQDVRIRDTLAAICHLVGRYGNIIAITDTVICLLAQLPHQRKECLFLLSLFLQGQRQEKSETRSPSSNEIELLIGSVIDTIMVGAYLDAPLNVVGVKDVANVTNHVDHNASATTAVAIRGDGFHHVVTARMNVVQVATTLHLIASCATLGGIEFVAFLDRILCPLMERAGEKNAVVACTARVTLGTIAHVCGYPGGVGGLIAASFPQFWYQLSMRLRRLPQFPSAPLVLQVALEFSNVDMVSYTAELVEEVLDSLDLHHQEKAVPLLRVLLVYVVAVARGQLSGSDCAKDSKENSEKEMIYFGGKDYTKINSERTSDKKEGSIHDDCFGIKNLAIKDNDIGDGNCAAENLASFLLDYHRDKMLMKLSIKDEFQKSSYDEKDFTSSAESDFVTDTEEMEPAKKSIPKCISLVEKILEKCSHLLFVNDRQIKLSIMDIILAAVDALNNWEDQKLPVFHKLWKPLTLRLRDTDFVVMLRALEVLSRMIATSGDFLRNRTLKEVLPPLLHFLRVQSGVSRGKVTSRSGYHLTLAFKAQNRLLKELACFQAGLRLGFPEVSQLVEVALLYTDTHQPEPLCRAAVETLECLALKFPHHVWLALAYVQHPITLIIPSPALAQVRIFGQAQKNLSPAAIELFKRISFHSCG